ncbi:hypothetical protein [Burkholderia diffusa]|uniref:hypothetical protein n=1 Tax=Burkholderia diffusa TaxID=488732 RepID=UPI000841FAD8|nr:hypothetical protein [Burkholderia diffusa]AOI57416.1 hypothetical protein WI26_07260 [Burkholderia diffusa]
MKRAWKIAHLAFVALLIAIGFLAVTCVFIAIFRANVEPKDFWTAVGVPVNALVAIGTFGAAGIALWISKDQRRQQKNDDAIRAKLSAAGAVPKLESALWKTGTAYVAVKFAANKLEEGSEQTMESLGERTEAAKRAAESLEGIPYLNFDEIRSMVALPDNCAMQIEAAQGRMRAAMADLHEICARHAQFVNDITPVEVSEYLDHDTKAELRAMHVDIEAKYQGDLLSNARDRLTEAVALLKNAIRICTDQTSAIDATIFDARFGSW